MSAPAPVSGERALEIVDLGALCADHEASFDAVVVGSGAGGAVLAKELAEGGMRVAVVEEGAHHAAPHRDLAFEAIGRLYRDFGTTATIGKPVIPIPMGKCFGGTTVINSGTCFRTPRTVVEYWRNERGLTAIEPETVDRACDRVEQVLQVAPAEFDVMSRNNALFHELLQQAGFEGAPLRRNAPGCEGCGMCCYGCTSGAKQSMERSYLPRALRAGATAFTRARVGTILRDGRGAAYGITAQGVEGPSGRGGKRLTLRAPIVAIACGSMLTPQLLYANGIARRNPHLGQHLTIHPASKVVAEFDERIDSWNGIPQAYYSDALHDDGILFEGVAMPPDLGPMAMPFTGEKLAHYIRHYRYMATFGFLISDTAEGSMVRLPMGRPLFRYSLTATDVRRIRRAIAFLARIFLQGGAKAVHTVVRSEQSSFTTLDEVDRFEAADLRAVDIDCMGFHPLGSCRMGRSAQEGVCNAHHEVFGTPGLYICDGSAVPTALGVNPQETIMALATRLAEHLLGTRLHPSRE